MGDLKGLVQMALHIANVVPQFRLGEKVRGGRNLDQYAAAPCECWRVPCSAGVAICQIRAICQGGDQAETIARGTSGGTYGRWCAMTWVRYLCLDSLLNTRIFIHTAAAKEEGRAAAEGQGRYEEIAQGAAKEAGGKGGKEADAAQDEDQDHHGITCLRLVCLGQQPTLGIKCQPCVSVSVTLVHKH